MRFGDGLHAPRLARKQNEMIILGKQHSILHLHEPVREKIISRQYSYVFAISYLKFNILQTCYPFVHWSFLKCSAIDSQASRNAHGILHFKL